MTPQPLRIRRLAALGSKFLIVGGLSTVIEIAVFNLCMFVFGFGLVSSKVIASLVALVNAYVGNKQWVFRKQAGRGRWSELAYFLIVNVACLLLGTAIIWLGSQAFIWAAGREAGPFAVNIINLGSIGIVVLVRFVLYHKVVFRAAHS